MKRSQWTEKPKTNVVLDHPSLWLFQALQPAVKDELPVV